MNSTTVTFVLCFVFLLYGGARQFDRYKLCLPIQPYLFVQVPVRVAGGLLFELLGQSVGDPFVEEDDIPVVIRSWQAQNFLLTSLHVKGSSSNVNVLGITEVQVRQC